MRQRIDGIIFDIDGTLWNAVPGVTKAWQEEIDRQGYSYQLTVETMQPLFGQVIDTFGDVLFSDLPVEERRRLAHDCENSQNDSILRNRMAKVYPGMVETLKKLSVEYPLFIVTNAAPPYVELVMDYAEIRDYITDYEGIRDENSSKAGNIRLIMERNHLKKPVYVGDTHLDQKSSKEAGALFIWASYGLDPDVKSERKIEAFTELPGLIERMNEEEADA